MAPDPSLQLKGLLKMTKKILDGNRELQFRVSLVYKAGLGIDTTPTDATVEQFATHLLAEIEQLALAEKRSTTSKSEPKIKSFEVERGEEGKGKGKDRGEEGQRKCRFYLTEGGCRKGKDCKWSHDQKKTKGGVATFVDHQNI